MSRTFRSLLLYGLGILGFGILALITIPTTISIIGAQEWAELAAIQSVGVFASTIIAYGWTISGPRHAAGSSVGSLPTLIVDSLKVRGLLLLLIGSIALAACSCWRVNTPWLPWLAFLSTASIGLRVNWLFIGCSRPGHNLAIDTLPRFALIAVGLAVGELRHEVAWIFLGPIIGIGLSIFAGYLVARRWAEGKPSSLGRGLQRLLRDNVHDLLGSLSGGVSSAAPIVLVSLLAPDSLAAFALIDRIWKQGNTAFSPFFDYLHSTVGPRTKKSLRVGKRAIGISGLIAASGATLFVLISSPLVNWMGHGQIQIGFPLVVLFGVLFTASNTTLVMTEIGLSVTELLKRAAPGLFISACLGLTACGLLAWRYGAVGALSGLIFGYISSIAYGAHLMSNASKDHRGRRARGPAPASTQAAIGRHDKLVRDDGSPRDLVQQS